MGGLVGSLLWVRAPAAEFEGLFREVYLAFHRRDAPRGGMAGASRAVLQHLVLAGPLTVGEMAVHLDRAQSVVSETHAGVAGPSDDPGLNLAIQGQGDDGS